MDTTKLSIITMMMIDDDDDDDDDTKMRVKEAMKTWQ